MDKVHYHGTEHILRLNAIAKKIMGCGAIKNGAQK